MKLVIGILAHVDAGKTTLSEALLYMSGSIRKMGRVDKRDTFLDTYEMERTRGITIFSKQAELFMGDMQVTLLDTPGHVDFSAEMERTLQVLDYAILVISGADGVQAHTRTLWRLLKQYQIPTFLFINKMDQPGTEKADLMKELREKLDEGCVDFGEAGEDIFFENIAVCEEAALEKYLNTGSLAQEEITDLICSRHVFPCFFGSALKLHGVDALMDGLEAYSATTDYSGSFGARVYKIARDEQGNRLTYIKITGGNLKVKTVLTNQDLNAQSGASNQGSNVWEEKINQIRIYSGTRYESVNEVQAGTVCAVTGLSQTYPGEGLGAECGVNLPLLTPVLIYEIRLPDGCDAAVMLPKLRLLEEEEPELHIVWNEKLQEIQASIMGDVQIEVIKNLILERFGVEVEMGSGNIVYRETIRNMVEGVGHFEPLRHYAEVHLLMEPGESGSGIQIASDCSEDILDRNWQHLILTHLAEKEHCGVLTGSPLTDIRITLVTGRAHIKHTEGGDFRQATYRAVRQGLMQAESILLEPYYEFCLEVPEQMTGRAMADMERMSGTFSAPQFKGDMAVISGSVPVSTVRDYQRDVSAYTKGHGRFSCSFKGYERCHDQEEVIFGFGYDCERDSDNPSGSVFCAHGAGFVVSWEQVKDYMHLESCHAVQQRGPAKDDTVSAIKSSVSQWIGEDEVDKIIAQTYYSNSRGGEKPRKWKRTVSIPAVRTYSNPVKPQSPPAVYLLVDGYNIIYAWPELAMLAETNIDGARERLLEILSNYQSMKKCRLIAVFDAYRVQGHQTEILTYHNIHVVFTKEAETADQYIEKFAQENGRKYDVTVATSDGLEQIIILGRGCKLWSAREFQQEVEAVEKEIRDEYLKPQPGSRNYLLESLSEAELDKLKDET